MAKNFRHMCRQQSCEKLPPVPQRGLFFLLLTSPFCTFTRIADEKKKGKKKDLPKKQHECPTLLDPPPTQFVPLPHFTPTKMSD